MIAVARHRAVAPGGRFVAPVVDEVRAAQARAIAGGFPLRLWRGHVR